MRHQSNYILYQTNPCEYNISRASSMFVASVCGGGSASNQHGLYEEDAGGGEAPDESSSNVACSTRIRKQNACKMTKINGIVHGLSKRGNGFGRADVNILSRPQMFIAVAANNYSAFCHNSTRSRRQQDQTHDHERIVQGPLSFADGDAQHQI